MDSENVEVKTETDNTYLQQLITERDSLDPASYNNCLRLLNEEISAVQSGKRKEKDIYIDVINPRKTKIEAKIAIPVKEFPKYNFVGKLLGPKGSSLQQLQKMTGTKMSILGRGSMKNRTEEEKLRNEGSPKYAHLNKELHLLIEAYCPALEAYSKVTRAIEEVQKYLIPDPNDEIRQGQLMELGFTGEGRGGGYPTRGRGGPPSRGAGRGPPGPGGFGRGRGAPRGRPVPGGRAGFPPAGLGRGSASRPLAYQSTEEEYYEESYDQGYEDPYDGYSTPRGGLAADDYGYERSAGDGYQGYDYGSGGGFSSAPRLKAPSGYAQKPAARPHPYARY